MDEDGDGRPSLSISCPTRPKPRRSPDPGRNQRTLQGPKLLKVDWDSLFRERQPPSGVAKQHQENQQKPNTFHTCPVCGRHCQKLSILQIHMRIHTGEKPYPCPDCGKKFAHQGAMRRHHLTHTGEKPYSCSVCGKSFTQSGHLKEHQQSHSGEKHHCLICQKQYIRAEDLKIHHRVHTGERPYRCAECGKSYIRSKNLRAHKLTHQRTQGGGGGVKVKEEKEEEVAEGEEVGWRFPDLRESPVHGSGSEGSPPTSHINKDPGDQSSTKAIESQGPDRSHEEDSTQTPGMNAHIVEEEEEEEIGGFINSEGEEFGWDSVQHRKWRQNADCSLVDWVSVQHRESPNCGLDSKESPPTSEHPEHQENQKTKISHCCSVCGRECYKLSVLQIHMRIHTGEKPYPCPDCGKKFAHQGAMRRHLLTHTGEKPYSCSVCGKSFTQSGHLREHQQSHSGEKPHLCLVCGRGFSRASDLRIHHRVHTGERPYSCDYCGKRYVRSQKLRAHQRTHHSDRTPVDAGEEMGDGVKNQEALTITHDKPSVPIGDVSELDKNNDTLHHQTGEQ